MDDTTIVSRNEELACACVDRGADGRELGSVKGGLIRYASDLEPEIGSGEAVEIARGVHWLRMPLPGPLRSVNVFALEDEDGWTVVDTGLRDATTLEAWRNAIAKSLGGRSVRRTIVTHMHPDHAGMAGWLSDQHGTHLYMARLEYMTLRMLISDTGPVPEGALAFFRAAGMDAAWLDNYRLRFGEFGRRLYPLPIGFRALRDGEVVAVGERDWRIICCGGHSPEHACLWASDGLLFSGDEVLPTISSNVSVQPYEPEANPLSDWLFGLSRLRGEVPDEVLVMPGHGRPFYGLHARIDDLIAGHEKGLVRLRAMLAEPRRAVDVFPALFRREITDNFHRMLAAGEALAHLHCLAGRGLAKLSRDSDGIVWWEQA